MGELTLYFCLVGPRQDAEEMCGSEGGIQELQLGRSVSGDMRQEVNEEEGRGREEVMVGWGGSR